MTTDELLASMSSVANAPGGVDRLRQMILNLAVQGRLVPQDPSDEPASVLLERIRVEREELVRAKVMKTPKPLPATSRSEIPFDLPMGWEWARLGDLTVKIGSGSTPRGGKTAYVTNGIPFLRSQNVWNDGLHLDDVAFIPPTTHEIMSGTKVLPRDLLLNITGASIGRCAIVPRAPWAGANVSQHVCIIRFTRSGPVEFGHTLLTSPEGWRQVMSEQVGMSREGLSKKRLELFLVPVPPVPEQARIEARVRELMSVCDLLADELRNAESLRSATTRSSLSALTRIKRDDETAAKKLLRDNLETVLRAGDGAQATIAEIRKAILDLAVRGRLSTPASTDEPAAVLLGRIRTDRDEMVRTKQIRKTKQLPPVDADEIPYTLPSGWEWARIGDVVQQRLGKMLDEAKNSGTSRPYLRNTNVQWGRIDTTDIKSMRLEDDEIAEYRLRPGDLLVCEGGVPGRCAIWSGDEEMYFQKALHRLRPLGGVSSRFIEISLRSAFDDGRLAQRYTGATIQHLTGVNLSLVPMAVPGIQEQQRIVDRVDELLSLTDDLSAAYRHERFYADALSASLVAALSQNAPALTGLAS